MIKPAASTPTILLKARRLETSDVAAYRELRLESLKGHPEAFGSSWEDEAEKPISWWSQRLETNTVFGGWVNRSPLVGLAGLRVQERAKARHKGVLCGMYVRSEARGTGLAPALVQQVIEHARNGCGRKALEGGRQALPRVVFTARLVSRNTGWSGEP